MTPFFLYNDLGPGVVAPFTDGAFGSPPAIFVKANANGDGNNFMEDFQWVKGITTPETPSTPHQESEYQDVQLGTIGDFLAARKAVLESKGITNFDWPEFEARLREMNHKNPRGSRTGDIVVVLDSREGYLAVNYADEEYPGWHGGPTVAESNVPMMFAMPGTLFNSSSGETIEIPEALSRGFGNGVNSLLGMGSNSEIQLRDWHFGRILKGIVTEFRE